MVATTMRRVRERSPTAEFLLLSYYPKADRKLSEGASLQVDNVVPKALLVIYMPFAFLVWLTGLVRLRWPDALLPGPVRRLRACRALLDVSGISFHDGRLGVLIYNVFCIWPALLMKVPVVHLSQARGPFKHPLNRLLSKLFLSACRHSYARGRITAELMAELGLAPHKWSEAADIAFSFRDGDSLTVEGEAETQAALARIQDAKAQGRTVVAVSPSSVVLGKTEKAQIDYLGILARAVRHLQASGRDVIVLPNATRAGQSGLRNNDIPVIEALRERLEESGDGETDAVIWITHDLNTDGIRSLIASCELLITSRFHAMVAGLSLQTPVFVVGWSHKYEEVLEMFGCSEDAIDFASLDAGLLPALDRMIAACPERRKRIAAALPDVQASSLRQFEQLQERLFGRDGRSA